MPKAPKGPVSDKRTRSTKRSKSDATDTTARATRAIDAEAIAARAYELFLRRGATHGNDWADWLAAERELAEGRLEPMAEASDYSRFRA